MARASKAGSDSTPAPFRSFEQAKAEAAASIPLTMDAIPHTDRDTYVPKSDELYWAGRRVQEVEDRMALVRKLPWVAKYGLTDERALECAMLLGPRPMGYTTSEAPEIHGALQTKLGKALWPKYLKDLDAGDPDYIALYALMHDRLPDEVEKAERDAKAAAELAAAERRQEFQSFLEGHGWCNAAQRAIMDAHYRYTNGGTLVPAQLLFLEQEFVEDEIDPADALAVERWLRKHGLPRLASSFVAGRTYGSDAAFVDFHRACVKYQAARLPRRDWRDFSQEWFQRGHVSDYLDSTRPWTYRDGAALQSMLKALEPAILGSWSLERQAIWGEGRR